MSETSPQNGLPTRVWFVQGKKANKDFRTALALHRENATLQAEYEKNPPPKDDVKQADPQPDEPKEEGHDA